MTFEEFHQLCIQAVGLNQQVCEACPITIGDLAAPIISQVGDSLTHQLVIFRMKPDAQTLRTIYASVRFSFDAPNNQTVITPVTLGS